MAYLNDQREPEFFILDGQDTYDMFKKDVTNYKIRHEYGGTTVDWRPAQGNLVPAS